MLLSKKIQNPPFNVKQKHRSTFIKWLSFLNEANMRPTLIRMFVQQKSINEIFFINFGVEQTCLFWHQIGLLQNISQFRNFLWNIQMFKYSRGTFSMISTHKKFFSVFEIFHTKLSEKNVLGIRNVTFRLFFNNKHLRFCCQIITYGHHLSKKIRW